VSLALLTIAAIVWVAWRPPTRSIIAD
jgi:hypothetical protein